jgi:predicted AlkP superfamily pyrophosphatase or phosphodiesterase
LRRYIDHAPNLARFEGLSITTVAPSTTATALTSLTTGATPLEHGIIGYRMSMDGVVMNTLRWGSDRSDLRKAHPPDQVQPVPPFAGMAVPVLSRRDLESSAFSQAHLRGSVPLGWRAMSSIVEQARVLLESGAPFVYAYYDGLDKIAHERGFGPYYLSELRTVDWLVGELLATLPAGTTIAITADHGQVAVGPNIVGLPEEILRLVDHQSGEGRFRWLHCRRDKADELYRRASDLFGEIAWVRSRDQILDEEWFGHRGTSAQSDESIRRMGDVALVPFADVSFDDPADSGPFTLECRHGSLTAEEMFVPLLAHTVL